MEPKLEDSSDHGREKAQPGPQPSPEGPGHDGGDRALEEATAAPGDQGARATKKPLAFHLAFVGMAITVLIFHLDATALGVAIPSIAADLRGTSLESFWANICYNLCVVSTQPLWASTSDAFGRKPALYVSMVLFAVGSLVFALARSMATIVAGRVLQGLGGGGMDVLAEIVLADMTTLQERSFYLGLMALPISIGSILGPSIGAIFSTYANWRWIGWVNLPLLGLAGPLIAFFLRLRAVQLDASLAANLKRLDFIGMILYVAGITLFVLPLSWAGALYPWGSWQTLLPMLLGVAVLVAFAVYEGKPAAPIVPHRLFSSMTANMTLVGGFAHGVLIFSVLQYLPLLYQAIELETVLESAISLLPTSITSVVVAACSMMAVAAFGGGYLWVIRISWFILALGTGLLIVLDLGSPSSMRFGVPILWGAGVAMLRLLLLPMQASVKNVDDTGLAIGQLLTFRLFGGLVGLAIASTTFSSVFASSISSVRHLEGPLAPLTHEDQAIAFIPMLRELRISSDLLDPVLQVYLRSFQTIFYIATGFSVLGLITSLFTKEIPLSKSDLGRQRFED